MTYTRTNLREDAAGYGTVLAVRDPETLEKSRKAPPCVLITRSDIYDRVRSSFLRDLCAEVLLVQPVTCYRGWDDSGPEANASPIGDWFSPMRPAIREEYRRGTAAAVQYSTGGGNRLDNIGEFSISSGARLIVGRASPQLDLALRLKLGGGAIQFVLSRQYRHHLYLVRSWDAHRGDPGVSYQL